MMAERVVDVLEMVEVDREHRRDAFVLAGVGDHGAQALAEEGAVRQAGKRVMQRQMTQPVLALGDTAGAARRADDRAWSSDRSPVLGGIRQGTAAHGRAAD